MNILYLNCHDMGCYNSVYGYQIPTPNLQKLAEESTVFTNMHCTSPTCSPSRGSLMTGRYPHSNGLTGLVHRGFSLRDPQQHLAYFFQSHGFHTALSGFQHEASDPRTLGYQQLLHDGKSSNNVEFDHMTTDAAVRFLNEKHAEPFFLTVGFLYPHREYLPYRTIDPDFVRVPSCLPDCDETRRDFADYMESVRFMDQNAGKVLQALRDNGLYEDTLIIMTTDHGIAFPFMKCNLYATGTNVTLMIKLPGQKQRKRVDTLCSQLDVYPTLCEILEFEKPKGLQGLSLLPLLKGEEMPSSRTIFGEVNYHACYEPMRSIRTERYLLIKRFDLSFNGMIMPNMDDGKTKRYLMEKGLREMVHEPLELYDTLLDPAERNNLANKDEYRGIRDELLKQLEEHMRQTEDPLLSGSYPKPAGAKINLRSCTHPYEKNYEA
ncbi:MAG: sulfatase [Candidatus Merdivicinus sp.]|jgi:N-sulfoglucosamine sulfohydrolase